MSKKTSQMTQADGLITLAEPVLAEMRERWMAEFTRTMCEEIQASQSPEARIAVDTARKCARHAADLFYGDTYKRMFERAMEAQKD